MAYHIFPVPGSGSFQQVVAAFLAGEGLPFASVLSAERIERVFAKHGCQFGCTAIYTTAIMVWSFLWQVLRDGKEASCQAAVARVVSYCQQHGTRTPPTDDTGDYCRARAKLVGGRVARPERRSGGGTGTAADSRLAVERRHHAKLIDGFTFTMPDTPANQAAYPQPKTQKAGVGLPIARAVAILSLATACVMDLAIGPYPGKRRAKRPCCARCSRSLAAGDIAVADRYYCSFLMIALLRVARHATCVRGSISGGTPTSVAASGWATYDHLIVWTRPQRPEWMDEATYARIPETLTLREIRFQVVEPGRRTQTDRHHHHAARRRRVHRGRHRRAVWFSLELGIGHPRRSSRR